MFRKEGERFVGRPQWKRGNDIYSCIFSRIWRNFLPFGQFFPSANWPLKINYEAVRQGRGRIEVKGCLEHLGEHNFLSLWYPVGNGVEYWNDLSEVPEADGWRNFLSMPFSVLTLSIIVLHSLLRIETSSSLHNTYGAHQWLDTLWTPRDLITLCLLPSLRSLRSILHNVC